MPQLNADSIRSRFPRSRAGTFHDLTLLCLACMFLISAGCGDNRPAPLGPPARKLIAVSVDPPSAEATQPTGTSPFSATGTFDQPPTTEENLSVTWVSSDPTIATIDRAGGIATCIAEGGPITITASSGQTSGTAQLTCVTSPQTGSGNCVYQCGSTRCGALTGYCSISTGNQCKQVFRSGACPQGQPAGATATDTCGVGVDTSRSCSE